MYHLATQHSDKTKWRNARSGCSRTGIRRVDWTTVVTYLQLYSTVIGHSLIGRVSGMLSSWAWQCCKETYLHEVSVT